MKKSDLPLFLKKETKNTNIFLGLTLKAFFLIVYIPVVIIAIIVAFSIVAHFDAPSAVMKLIVPVILFPLVLPLVPLNYYSKRYSQKSAKQLLSEDHRKPIFYLRSFKDDEGKLEETWLERALYLSSNKGTNDFSTEQKLVTLLKHHGPVIACGNPNETMPPIGAARYYVEHDEWKSAVKEMCEKSNLVVVRLGMHNTDGVWWETNYVLENVPPERVLFFLEFEKVAISDLPMDTFENSIKRYHVNISSYSKYQVPKYPDGTKIMAFSRSRHPISLRMDSTFLQNPDRIILRNCSELFTKNTNNKEFIKFLKHSNRIFGDIGCIMDRMDLVEGQEIIKDPVVVAQELIKTWVYTDTYKPEGIFEPNSYKFSTLHAPKTWLEFQRVFNSFSQNSITHNMIYLTDEFKDKNIDALNRFSNSYLSPMQKKKRNLKNTILIEVSENENFFLHEKNNFKRLQFFSRHGRAIKYFGGKALKNTLSKIKKPLPGKKRIFFGNILVPLIFLMVIEFPFIIIDNNKTNKLQTEMLYGDIQDSWLGVEWGSSLEEASMALQYYNEEKVLKSKKEALKTVRVTDIVHVADQSMNVIIAFGKDRFYFAALMNTSSPEQSYKAILIDFTELYGAPTSSLNRTVSWHVGEIKVALTNKVIKAGEEKKVTTITYTHGPEFHRSRLK